MNQNQNEDEGLESVIKLSKDLRKAVLTMSPKEVRFLVDAYYQMQDNRLRAEAQIRAMPTEPHEVLEWLHIKARMLENQVKAALSDYSNNHAVGRWMRKIKGIGPVISAGLLAHIDIKEAPTVGHIWSYAGLDPTKVWKTGEKRPWNPSLKTLCWKIGECFVKVSGHEDAVYGQLYLKRKALEIQRNASGELKEQAAAALRKKSFRKETVARKHYEQGLLPPAHIHRRAARYAVKQFLSDLHAYWFRHEFKADPPKPYPIAILGHAHHRSA